jgi:ribosomal protein S18 acetylase RimI-like enzyme
MVVPPDEDGSYYEVFTNDTDEYAGRVQVSKYDHQWDLWSLQIMEEHRRKGCATELLMHIAKEAEPLPIWLNVYSSNEGAQKLYLGLGFEYENPDPQYSPRPMIRRPR